MILKIQGNNETFFEITKQSTKLGKKMIETKGNEEEMKELENDEVKKPTISQVSFLIKF